MEPGDLLVAFVTISGTIFVAELTDKDALLLLALATKSRPWTVFASGSAAFTITTAIIVLVGYLLVQFVPVVWVKLAGGVIMVGYAFWQYFIGSRGEEEIKKEEQKILARGLSADAQHHQRFDYYARKQIPSGREKKRSAWSVFLGAVLLLAILDLAGDATEVLTIVYVARYGNLILVFTACVIALIGASAVETILGNRLGKMLPVSRVKIFSFLVFLIIGSLVILTSFYPSLIPIF